MSSSTTVQGDYACASSSYNQVELELESMNAALASDEWWYLASPSQPEADEHLMTTHHDQIDVIPMTDSSDVASVTSTRIGSPSSVTDVASISTSPSTPSSSSSSSSSSSVGSVSSSQQETKSGFVQLILESPRMANKINQGGRVSEPRLRSFFLTIPTRHLYRVALSQGVHGNFKLTEKVDVRGRKVVTDQRQCFRPIDSSEKSRGLRPLNSWTKAPFNTGRAVSQASLGSIHDRYDTWTAKRQSKADREAGKPREFEHHTQHEGLTLLDNLPTVLFETRIVLKDQQPCVFETVKYLFRVLNKHPNFNPKLSSWDLTSLLKFWYENSTPSQSSAKAKSKKRQLESNQEVAAPSLINFADLIAAMRADGMKVPSNPSSNPLEFTLQWFHANRQADQQIIAALNEWFDSDATEFPLFPFDTNAAVVSSSSSSVSSLPTTPGSEDEESQPLDDHLHQDKKQRIIESFATFEPAALSVSQLLAPSKFVSIASEHASVMDEVTTQDESPLLVSPCSSPSFRSFSSPYPPPAELDLLEFQSPSLSSVNSLRITSPTLPTTDFYDLTNNYSLFDSEVSNQ